MSSPLNGASFLPIQFIGLDERNKLGDPARWWRVALVDERLVGIVPSPSLGEVFGRGVGLVDLGN
jgi:hypothetical protein